MKLKKRILSLLLCGAMLFSLGPQSVLAEENGQAGGVTAGTSGLCEHHPEHNADCGYTEGTAGTPCGHEHTADCYEEVTNCVHEHDEDCYPEESDSGNEATPSGAQKREPTECTHVCSEESGCITKELNCQHEHNSECGYSPAAEGTPCGYVCELCGGEDSEKPAGPSNAEAVTVASVQAMIDALPGADEITDDSAEEVKEQLEAIDEAKAQLSDEEIDELDMTRYAEAAAALGALAAPMLLANDSPDEQFCLTPGDTYYFDLSGEDIPGTANGSLPDSTLHYVPFTYAGTVDAYKLTSEMATTEEYAEQYKYDHSLYIADYNVTFNVDWNQLNEKQMIFGTPYTSYGVNYTMRAPSAGSQSNNGKDDSSTRGIPKSNEWDAILDKANQDWKDNTSGYIKNWSGKYSFGQDNYANASRRAFRGYYSARFWTSSTATFSTPIVGFRPVLEVLNSDTLGSGGLKVVTLDLGGGTLGNSSEDIQIIVKTGSEFTAPASDGMTRPDGNTGSYFMWLGSNGNSYAPGGSVPADVTELTVQWTAPTYAVTLNTNGGTINNGNVTSYTYGVGATLPTDVTRTGYTFKGWYDNENLTGSPVTAISNIETGNKEYWAKWEANAYTVTLNTNGGTINSGNVTEYTYGVGATLPTAGDMTYTGHTFVGWYYNENLTGSPVTAIGSTETGNKEYWAKWEATPNYLDLSGYPEFDNEENVTVNGRTYPIGTDGGRYVNLPETGDILQRFTYLNGTYSAAHENYPTGMAAYRILRQEGGAKLEPIDGLEDLLNYAGCSIRISGKQGIRMITGITQNNKKALTGKGGLSGYTLEEYGTLICWNTDVTSGDDFSLDMSCARSNYAYLKGKADPVFAKQDGKMLYTNVLVGFSLEDCAKDLVLRPYIKLKDMTTGETVTLYGGCVTRSIGYVALQNRDTYKPGTASYKYVHKIIEAVYGQEP